MTPFTAFAIHNCELGYHDFVVVVLGLTKQCIKHDKNAQMCGGIQ